MTGVQTCALPICGGRWVHEGEMERDGGVVGDGYMKGRWRGMEGSWKGAGGRWEMEEEWKERGMEGAGDLKKLNKFLKRKIKTSLPRVQLR